MRLSKVHLEFWRQRTANPRWASQIRVHPKYLIPTVSVDQVVNAHAGPRDLKKDHFEAGNVIGLLQLARKNGDLIPCLVRCASNGYNGNRKRAAYCCRWLKKMGYDLPPEDR